MKRILVPTDFSTYAENALKAAAQIAKKNNSELFLLHMLELPSQMSDTITEGNSIPEVMFFIEKAREMLESIKERPYLNGIIVNESVLFESAFKGIIEFSKKNDIDLIIMGSRGLSGFEEILIGSNTEKVVRHSEIPVLVIKKDTVEFKAENIVFASDFSKEAKKPFKKLLKFAQIFDSTLNLVMICTPSSFKTTLVAEKFISDFAANFDLKKFTSHIYNDANIEKGVINFSNSINADLIVMCTHNRTALSHFFNGSISEDLVNHSNKPVIAFKVKNK
ncbi:universal stress protein [Flavobacterium sp. 123]|uniref:universal stress protein n=1 Tax=Flavobacterium sp. 123 TaxID=2135627 RepID=UPI000EAEB54E|nr:universal stress protein [Flavobacterium sp. 123]RKS99136.1 nucleotide-binding universal stress UspA family protein [Flavobacterium sp. 123]